MNEYFDLDSACEGGIFARGSGDQFKNYMLLVSSCLVTQSCPTLCDPMDVAYEAPPSMGFSRQEYWSGLPFPSPGDLPNPGIKLESPALQADAVPSKPPGKRLII